MRSSKHFQEQYEYVFSPCWRENRSATVRCCGPWDRSPSSGAPPTCSTHPRLQQQQVAQMCLHSSTPFLPHAYHCIWRGHFHASFQAIFSQVHCTKYRPDQRKIKNNNNPKTVRPLCTTPLMLRSCIGQEDDLGWCMAPRLQLQSLQEQKAMVSSLHLRSWESGPFPVVYASYSAVLLGAL